MPGAWEALGGSDAVVHVNGQQYGCRLYTLEEVPSALNLIMVRKALTATGCTVRGIQPAYNLRLGVPRTGAFLVWMACPPGPPSRHYLFTHPVTRVPVSPEPARLYLWRFGTGDISQQMDAAAKRGYHFPLPDALRTGAPAPPPPRAASAPAAASPAAPAQAAPHTSPPAASAERPPGDGGSPAGQPTLDRSSPPAERSAARSPGLPPHLVFGSSSRRPRGGGGGDGPWHGPQAQQQVVSAPTSGSGKGQGGASGRRAAGGSPAAALVGGGVAVAASGAGPPDAPPPDPPDLVMVPV
jgi:hypothetical protein